MDETDQRAIEIGKIRIRLRDERRASVDPRSLCERRFQHLVVDQLFGADPALLRALVPLYPDFDRIAVGQHRGVAALRPSGVAGIQADENQSDVEIDSVSLDFNRAFVGLGAAFGIDDELERLDLIDDALDRHFLFRGVDVDVADAQQIGPDFLDRRALRCGWRGRRFLRRAGRRGKAQRGCDSEHAPEVQNRQTSDRTHANEDTMAPERPDDTGARAVPLKR